MFFRRATDGTKTQVSLENQYAGPFASPCWIVGGGPSLTSLATTKLLQSPAPRFAMNLAGAGVLRPQFWTSYDPTSRFHRSIYLDPSITKFVHENRSMDVVPETTFKVCECPNLYVIDREKQRGFQDFPGVGDSPITDWQDSLIQCIDIAYRLGFRQLYLVGTEMLIKPSRRWQKAASALGVMYQHGELLGEFARRCSQAKMSRQEMEELSTGQQYHFDETKSLSAAIQTDLHYYRVCQYLRLSRQAMALRGLQLVSVTPGSRLNDHFPHCRVETASRRIHATVGNPALETTRGLYTEKQNRQPKPVSPMRDFRPHFWPNTAGAAQGSRSVTKDSHLSPCNKLKENLRGLAEIPVDLNEEG